MTFTLNINREVTNEEIINLIDGTGVLSWEWWRYVDINENTQTVTFTAYDGITDGEVLKDFEVTFEEIIEAVSIATQYVSPYDSNAVPHSLIPDEAIFEDLGLCDAGEADCILQLAVYGELMYG